MRLKINNIEDGVVLQFGSRHNFSAPLRRHDNCSFRGSGLAVDWSSFRLVNAALLAVVCCGLLPRTDCGSEHYKIKFFNISCSIFFCCPRPRLGGAATPLASLDGSSLTSLASRNCGTNV